jgi:hypothetical protein
MSVTPQTDAGDSGGGTVDEPLGPINVVVIAYPPGAPMTGEAAPLLVELAERGIIRVFDAMVVMKGDDGSVAGFELKDLSASGLGDFAVFEGASSGLLGDEDAAAAADSIDNGWSAAVIVYENRWAVPFISAVHRNGGIVLDSERISPEELAAVLDATEAS